MDEVGKYAKERTAKSANARLRSAQVGPMDVSLGPIVLDGPSALAFYRDRDDLIASKAATEEPWNPVLLPDEYLDDYWLSDEDVAASLAETNIFGALARTDDEELLSSTIDGLPELKKSRMRYMKGSRSNSRDLKRVPYDKLGIRPPAKESPLYILVPQADQRRVVKHANVRLCTTELPPRSFFRLRSDAYVPTPEFTFLLMARYLDLCELIALGLELCGHYRLVGASTDAPLASSKTLYGQESLTTPARIAALLEQAKGFNGLQKAKRACKYLAAGSASPMETALYMLMCLPCSLGGYGLTRPTLNARRKVSQRAGSFVLSKSLVPDLFWPDSMVDVEYDSEEFHASADALRKGARRTMALRAMNVEVLSVTRDMLYDERAFDAVVRLVAKRVGCRVRRPAQQAVARRELLRRAVLFGLAS